MLNKFSIALTIGASVGGAISGIKQLGGALASLRNTELSTSQKITQLSESSIGSFKMAISPAIGLGGAIMGLSQQAITFESAMADVKKVVDFKTPQGFKKLSNDILDLTRVLPMTAEELAAITASGGQLGVAEQDLKSFTTTIAKMSVAFDMSADASGDAMAKLANVYKIPIKNISDLGDAINELSNSSPAKASDIVSTLGRIGGVAQQFGLTANAAAALSNSFISLGKSPEVAGTAINGMLTKLITADKAGAKFQAALNSMGISAKQLKKDIAKNGEAALVNFLKQVQKLPKESQMGTLVDLFGLEYADKVAVLAGNIDILDKSLGILQDTDEKGNPKYLGSMQKEFEARAATTENNIQLLKNNFTELAITLGESLLPIINKFVSSLKPIVSSISQWVKANPALISQIIEIGGYLVGAWSGFFLVSSGISAMTATGLTLFKSGKKVFKILSFLSPVLLKLSHSFGYMLGAITKGAVMFVKAFAIMGRALLTNPIGLIITGIAVAAYLIYDNWGKIAPWFANLWQNISSYFSQFWDWIKSIWSNVTGWVSSVWSGVSQFFSNLWTNISNFFNSGIDNIANTILNFSPLGLFYQIFQSVMDWFGVELPQKFSAFGENLINSFVDSIKNTWNNVKESITGFGNEIISGFTGGVKDTLSSAKETMLDLGDSVSGWFKQSLDINSPSRVFMGYGENTVQGLVIGIDKKLNLAEQSSDNLSQAIKTTNLNQNEQPTTSLLNNYQPLNRNSVTNSATNTNQAMTVHFNPIINLNENNSTGIKEQLQQGLKMSLHEFEQMLRQVQDHQQWRSY